MGRETLWWGRCAWDAFALPHLLPDEPGVLVVAGARAAAPRTLRSSTGRRRRRARKWRTFSRRRSTCGATLSTPAAISACSAGRLVSTPGSGAPGTNVGTSWTWTRSGGSRRAGTPDDPTPVTNAASSRTRRSISAQSVSTGRSGDSDSVRRRARAYSGRAPASGSVALRSHVVQLCERSDVIVVEVNGRRSS